MSEFWDDDGKPQFWQSPHGFQLGAARVIRVAADPKWGVVIRIQSITHPAGCYIDVRVTPEGTKVEVL